MILDLFDQYAEKMTQIRHYQRSANLTAEKELELLTAYEDSMAQRPDLQNYSESELELFLSSIENMYFYSAFTPNMPVIFGQKVSSVKKRKESVIMRKNKQYQWLLAESYEVFKGHMINLYTYMTTVDSSLLPLDKLHKGGRPQNMMKELRKISPDIERIENDNTLGINLKLWFFWVEELRHIIVHNGGSTSSEAKFIEDVLSKIGWTTNGADAKKYIPLFKSIFCDIKNEKHIWLIQNNQEFKKITGNLMAYAHVITCSLVKTCQKNGFRSNNASENLWNCNAIGN